MNTKPDFSELFDQHINYPDFEMQDRFNALVGIDDHKQKLVKIISLLVNPNGIRNWAQKYHPSAAKLINIVLKRTPLIVLSGDVGAGKTELGMTIGDAVARQEGIDINLFPLSLSTRGQGRVGEMTQLVSAAFNYTFEEAKKLKSDSGNSRGAVILLVDEADALAQSREDSQMHHEDKAGVNAFIRGVDLLSNARLPAAVIMCTNRLSALDPAIKRRAAEILTFSRPNEKQRFAVLSEPLGELGFSESEIKKIVELTGENATRSFGFTYSDLIQRLLPSIVLDAYPSEAVSVNRALDVAVRIVPTSPFKDSASS